jgi:acyl-CoA synthetase (AMP-forming)/AMP-acid ligase II
MSQTTPGPAGGAADRGQHVLLDWLFSPDSGHGIRFARLDGAWDFYSYEELAALARRHASQLRAGGAGPGSTVGIVHGNTPEFVAAFFGCLMLGCTPAPIAPPARFQDSAAYRDHLARIIRLGRLAAVSTTASLAALAASAATDETDDDVVVVVADPAAQAPEWTGQPLAPAIGLLQFSSGTTGPSRGVRVPLAALESNIASIQSWTHGTCSDAVASWAPLYHDMGLIGCLLSPVAARADVWLMEPEQFVRTPLRWLRCFGQDGATISAVPNFGLRHVLRRVGGDMLDGMDFAGWRVLIVGAERVEASTAAEFARFLQPRGFSGKAIMPAYGLAEATLAVTGSSPDEHFREVEVNPDSLIPGSVVQIDPLAPESITLVGCGRPVAGVGVRIVDNQGNVLGEREIGEIEVRGESIAHGYLSSAESTERLLNGVLRTGDAGFLHDGDLFVVGRIGDSVKVHGKWMFAEDIDNILTGIGQKTRHITLLGSLDGRDAVAVLVEGDASDVGESLGTAVASRIAELPVLVLEVPHGGILRTTSGKPRRRVMWERLVAGQLGASVVWKSRANDVRLGL